MTTYIGLLRGINVGSHYKIKMDELRPLLEAIPLNSVATYIQSGNFVFQSKISSMPMLRTKIQNTIHRHFKMDVAVLTRTKGQWQKLVASNPFVAGQALEFMHVALFDRYPHMNLLHDVETLKTNAQAQRGPHRSLYLYCPQGYGRTKLSNTFLEKKLNVKATTRNWKTVRHLLAMAEGM